MTARERFRRQMRFERVDHSVRWESWGFWGQTIARWRREGLPEGASPEEYFGLDPRVYLEVASGMTALPYDPAFEQVVIERTEKHVVYRNAQGILMRERKLDEAEAYRLLQKYSMDHRKSMRQVAEALILTHEMKSKI